MDTFYDTLFSKAGQMFALLAPVAFIFIVVAIWASVSGGGRSASAYLKSIAKGAVLVLTLSQFISWVGVCEDSVQSLVYGSLNANPAAVYERYKTLTADQSKGDTHGFWYSVFHLSEKELFKALIAAVLWTAQFVAKLTVYLAYVIYKLILAFAIAIAPLFIGFLATRSVFSIGLAFVLGTVGILLWPLGWGFASMVTDAFLTVMANADFVQATGMEEMKNLLAVAAAGLWIIFSTIAAPVIIQRAISTGANVGAALMSGGLAAVKSAAQAGSTAGAALAASGIGAPVAFAGAAGAGAAAFGSSALSGSSSSGSGYFLSNLARIGMDAFRGASDSGGGSDEGSGSEAGQGSSTPPTSNSSRSASSASNYTQSDPANDQQVADMIDQSKNNGGKAAS